MKKCAACKKKAPYPVRHAGIWFCKKHFSHYFERKVKQAIREFGVFEGNGGIGVFSGEPGSSSLLFILNGIVEGRKNRIVAVKRIAKKRPLGLVVTGHCLDEFVLKMTMHAMLNQPEKLRKTSPLNGFWADEIKMRHPAPLFKLYREEIAAYAKIRELPVGKEKKKTGFEKAVSSFIERMENGHPGTKHKMLKSLLYFSSS
jgi:tRNA(Ile)-lysidine synthase TilS/MesJ